ncbi:hypothetical protein LSH36_125g06000 [Paralvinella palmiformis]|uniref:Ig-like domain-containing protein n=1 Tax=Paralvinella palmiformis TaxID=53620 RepID=A0AAD9JX47_9ANNE|nr:hypothetical protein LSH36_125g06000 [Paralvinella palmiformis]
MFHPSFTAAFGCLLLAASVQGQEDYCVYEPGTFITTVTEEHDCVILDCNNITMNATRYTFEGWILANVSLLNSSYDGDKYSVDDDNWTLVIRNISHEDTGFYHCVLSSVTGERYLVRMGLNAKGPFFITGWEEYEKNTIVGLTAFGSFVVLLIIAELLWKFRYKSDVDDGSSVGEANARDVHYEKIISPTHRVELRTPRGHPAVPAYVPHQEGTLPSMVNDSEIRKRPAGLERRTNEQTKKLDQPAPGVDNIAFVPDGNFTPGIPDNAETTSL